MNQDLELIKRLPNPFTGYRLGFQDRVRLAEERGYERCRQDMLEALTEPTMPDHQQQVDEGDW